LQRVRTLQGVKLAATKPATPVAAANDEPLWRRSLSGDGEAFGAIFDRHRDRVFRHACRLAQTRHDAEDVAASAFLELWRRRTAVRLVDGSVLPWLLVTTTNLGRNESRGARRYRRLLERLPRAPEEPDVAQFALDVHALGVDARLRTALHSLKQSDAQLLVLVALEGYSVTEAAALLQLSSPAAYARLQRARTRLRQQLDEGQPAGDSDDHGGTR
jgi:RNA polymerase sigma-70 factor (ECF subfamily)